MKRIGESKEPTVKQMLAMAENLQEKLGVAAYVGMDAWAFSSDSTSTKYHIYLDLDHKPSLTYNTWPEALTFYRRLVKEGKQAWLGEKNVS